MKFDKKVALFLDRDGVINVSPKEHDYVKSLSEFKLIEEIVPILKKYQDMGYLLIVVTNQRGLSLGLLNEKDLSEIHNEMKKQLEQYGVKIDAIYFCGHGIEDNCGCRKPRPGMLLKAASDFDIDLEKSIIIGDKETDIQAGGSAGCKEGWLFSIIDGEINLERKL